MLAVNGQAGLTLDAPGRNPMSAAKLWAGLELRHLLALQAIAECGSFHRAAAKLDYTQSGISQQIGALERIVGERLIERPGGSRPVRLTPSGEVLLTHARAVFGHITAAHADVVAVREGSGGTLRVGAFQSVGATVLPPLMSRLVSERPRLRIDFTQTTSDTELFILLEQGELDVTFAMLPVPDGPFEVHELFCDPFVLIVQSGSELAGRREPVSLPELTELPLIVSDTCRSVGRVTAQMRERGFEPRIVHRSDDNGTVLGLVAAGAGVAFVPRLVAAGANGAVAVLELGGELPPRRVALAWRSDRYAPAAREAFTLEVQATCRALGLRPEGRRASAR
jgi:DNA-binding transcriptional LysR family regulator